MSKQKLISVFKAQKKMAQSLMAVAKQNYETAAHLESEAITALAELGVQQERARKGNALTRKEVLELKGRLTQ